MTDAWRAPRLWPGATVACVAGGPSLDLEQVRRLYLARAAGRVRVVAVNDSVFPAWWADALYACDWRWWRKHAGAPGFAGLKVALSNARGHVAAWPEIRILENTGTTGLETDPGGLRTGRGGGYQALNLAVHLGAARILLVGYDMKADAAGRTHWFGDHEDWPSREGVYRGAMLPHFASLVAPLARLGVAVVNCTPESALDAFPRKSLADCL